MASTFTAEPSTAMEETRNWLEMPDEIMGGMILQRFGAVEILINAQKVCTTWRRICNDPAMWKLIDINRSFNACNTNYFLEKVTKQAVDRSCGELMDISLEGFGTHDLIDYISQCSSKLNSLRFTNCFQITSFGLIPALKRLPHLETLHLSFISSRPEHVAIIGQFCPQLKSFKMETRFMDCDDAYALAVANSMPALCHLQLSGIMVADNVLQAILRGCPHLESLDLHSCFYHSLGGSLVKLCRERIKDFKQPVNRLQSEHMNMVATFLQRSRELTFGNH